MNNDYHSPQLLSNSYRWSLHANSSMNTAILIYSQHIQPHRGGAEQLITRASVSTSTASAICTEHEWNAHPATKGIKWPKRMQKTEIRRCMP